MAAGGVQKKVVLSEAALHNLIHALIRFTHKDINDLMYSAMVCLFNDYFDKQ